MAQVHPFTDFIAAVLSALDAGCPGHGAARECAVRIRDALATAPPPPSPAPPETLPACRHLQPALARAGAGPAAVAGLARAFAALAPAMAWRRKAGSEAMDPAFHDGHANTWLVGPDGMLRRRDVVVGASLVQPGVTYPPHTHPPEELYVVMSDGEWFNQAQGWYTPGPGGIVFHPPGIVHAMRAGDAPLLAVWCLWTGVAA